MLWMGLPYSSTGSDSDNRNSQFLSHTGCQCRTSKIRTNGTGKGTDEHHAFNAQHNYAAAQRNIPVALHTPTEAKLAITGNGQAQKIQVERMVTRILNLTKMPTPADAADALALAICHALRPAGALQGGEREQHLTAAQRQWAEAAQNSTRRRINHDRGM